MELLLTGMSILLIIVTWKLLLKKSVLDDHRDKLFDLRDSLRESFVQQGWDLNSPVYRHLRDLINGYLRFTEKYVFLEFLIVELELKRNVDLQRGLKSSFDKRFETVSSDQREFISSFRRAAVQVMMSYMIVSFGPFVIVVALMMPIVAVWMLVREFLSVCKAGGISALNTAVELQGIVVSLIELTIAFVAQFVLIDDVVEEYSAQQERA